MRINVKSQYGIVHSLPDDKTTVYRPYRESVHVRSCWAYDWHVVFDEMSDNEHVVCSKEKENFAKGIRSSMGNVKNYIPVLKSALGVKTTVREMLWH